ncbi:hypothetical protein E4534_21205, partial [Escherichia coli]|nr:hypothetical protein [Escherichia coli]
MKPPPVPPHQVVDDNFTAKFAGAIGFVIRKRTARAVLTGMCYSAGSAMRHGSSSLTRLTG